MLTQKTYRLPRAKMMRKLAELSNLRDQASTVYLPAGITMTEVDSVLTTCSSLVPFLPLISPVLTDLPTGAVIFWGEKKKLLVKPPFPLSQKFITDGYDTGTLVDRLNLDSRIGIILVRLGHYSIGIAENEKLTAHKTGTGLVHGRHRKGGSSANRFRRRRDEQTYHFLERVAAHAKMMFEPAIRSLNYFIYGGARTTISELCKHDKFFGQLEQLLLPPLLDIPNPSFTVLQQAVTDTWSYRLTEWKDETGDGVSTPDFNLTL